MDFGKQNLNFGKPNLCFRLPKLTSLPNLCFCLPNLIWVTNIRFGKAEVRGQSPFILVSYDKTVVSEIISRLH